MVDIDYLSRLLTVLKTNGVCSFEENGLKLYFNPLSADVPRSIPTKDHVINAPIDEQSLPPDLRTDNINSMDTLLNWSASPTEKEEPIPGTEDQPSIPVHQDQTIQYRQEPMPTSPP